LFAYRVTVSMEWLRTMLTLGLIGRWGSSPTRRRSSSWPSRGATWPAWHGKNFRQFIWPFSREHWTGKVLADKWITIFPVLNWPLALWKKIFCFITTSYSSRCSFVACNLSRVGLISQIKKNIPFILSEILLDSRVQYSTQIH